MIKKKTEPIQELSIEEKAKLFDELMVIVNNHIRKATKKKEPNKKIYAGTLDFFLFWDKYPRKEVLPKTRQIRNSMDDENRQKAIDGLERYISSVDNIKYMVYPFKYLMNEYWLNEYKTTKDNVEDLEVFSKYMKEGKVDVLKKELGMEKFYTLKEEWKESHFYLQ